jgi:hypothetical protein
MITGYNTDVRHGEVVFHVQTEDKGTGNPYIESLVYVGGQVLASKRASYAELLAGGKDEKDIVALMDHQHRTMIAAIRLGKLDAKLAALTLGKQTGQFAIPVTTPDTPLPASRPQVTAPPASLPPPPPLGPAVGALDAGATVARSAPPLTPAPAPVARPSRPTPMPERTLDQVILEYLTNEADQEQLVLLLDEDANLALGQRAELVLRMSSSKNGNPVSGAQISIRMISTVAEPRVLAVGRTDDRGVLPLAFDIPQVGRGTSALIITAASAIGRAELKHLL